MVNYIIDIGSTHIKLGLFNGKAIPDVVIKAETPYRIKSAQKQELDVLSVFHAILNLMDQANQIMSPNRVGLSTQMHSVLLTDSDYRPLSGAYTWADNRGAEVARQMRQTKEAKSLYQRTGTPIHAMNPFIKLKALSHRLSESVSDLSDIRVMDIKAYMIYRLTSYYQVDIATASASGLMNIQTKDWDDELLQELNLKNNQLPQIRSVRQSVEIQPDIKNRYDWQNEVKLVLGSTDGALANYAYLELSEQSPILSFGTSGAFRISTDALKLSPSGRYFQYYMTDDQFILGAPMNNMGNVLQWLYTTVWQHKGITFTEMLNQFVPKTERKHLSSAMFLPYLYGERAPFWDEERRARWINETQVADDIEKSQVIFEGIFLHVRLVLETLKQETQDPRWEQPLIVNGRLFTSEFVAQWVADILGHPLYVLHTDDASLMGGNRLITHQVPDIKKDKRYSPRGDAKKAYGRKYHKFTSYVLK